MIKLDNWNAWCNDKIVLHDSEGHLCLINLNTVLHIEEAPEGGSIVSCTEQYCFDVKESVTEILAIISEIIAESEARRKALEEEQRAAYEAQMKAAQAEQKPSEG